MASPNGKPVLKLQTLSPNMPPPSAVTTTPPSTETPRPILKLNGTSRQHSFTDSTAATGQEKKIKIRIPPSSQPSTPGGLASTLQPSSTAVTKTKAGRQSKPSAKLIESKKRGYESDEDRPMAARLESARPTKKIMLRPPSAKSPSTPYISETRGGPRISLKSKGEPIEHLPGSAYDSEASDREVDPTRETVVVLRAMPGEQTEYLHQAIENGTIGLSQAHGGGADFGVQFVDVKERRAMIQVNQKRYAAVLIDLPTVTEAMKTWDRKNMMKNSDVTQMLLCFAPVENEAEAKTVPLPPMVEKTKLKWPHGLTPPMHDAVNRRFRKTATEEQYRTAATVLAEQQKLDEDALESTFELIEGDELDGEFEDEDAEGEADDEEYLGTQSAPPDVDMGQDLDEAGLEAGLEAELQGIEMQEPEGATPGTQLDAPTPMTVEVITPAALRDEPVSEEDEEEASDPEDDDDDEEEEDEEEEDDEADEEKLAADRKRKVDMEDLADLEKRKANSEAEAAQTGNLILKKRLKARIDSFKKEIAVKRAALGLVDEDQ